VTRCWRLTLIVRRLLSWKIILKEEQVLYATQCWRLTEDRLLSYTIILKRQLMFICDTLLAARFEDQ